MQRITSLHWQSSCKLQGELYCPTAQPAITTIDSSHPYLQLAYRFTKTNKEDMPPFKKKKRGQDGVLPSSRKSISSNHSNKGKSSVDVGEVLTGLQPTLQDHIKKSEQQQEKVVSLLGEMKEANNNISVSMSRIADALAALAQGGRNH